MFNTEAQITYLNARIAGITSKLAEQRKFIKQLEKSLKKEIYGQNKEIKIKHFQRWIEAEEKIYDRLKSKADYFKNIIKNNNPIFQAETPCIDYYLQ
jgi:uncharacterized coiled-coil protein SlyX